MVQGHIDIWFGPGALRGVFGAGVAYGLQESFDHGMVDAARLRLFGSSVGCLTAVYLATGNAGCGLDIFNTDTRPLIRKRNFVPALAARLINRFGRIAGRSTPIVPVPSVLNVAHVLTVMARRTPQLRDQLRTAPMPVFAEAVSSTGTIRHTELRSAEEPLAAISGALNAYPFTYMAEIPALDSAIQGYGFVELLRSGKRPLAVILNERAERRFTETLADAACAALCGDRTIARLYWHRQRNQRGAIQVARHQPQQVLLITPPRAFALRQATDFEQAHRAGKEAAYRVVEFINQGSQGMP
jgi:hypothetical protein